MRRSPDNKDSTYGFTLIELMFAVALIGTLAAIAIPQYTGYKRRAFDTQARSDLRNAATAMEAYYASQNKYPESIEDLMRAGARQTQGVKLSVVKVDNLDFEIKAESLNCAEGTGVWAYNNGDAKLTGKDCQ